MQSIRAALWAALVLTVPQFVRAQDPLAAALDSPGFDWKSGGDDAWIPTLAADAEAGNDVAELRFGDLGNGWMVFRCHSAWLEAVINGPGVFAASVRHNGNPYTRIDIAVDGHESESWEIPPVLRGQPGQLFSDWRRLTTWLAPGPHVVRLRYEFGCGSVGTLPFDQPAVQVDNIRVLPLLPPDVLAAVEVADGASWAAGGALDFVRLAGVEAHDGVDALRAPAVSNDIPFDRPDSPWLRHDVEGPLTLSWWERDHSASPWVSRSLFVPPGPHTFVWVAPPDGGDIDSFQEEPAPEVSLGDALESGGLAFTQVGGQWRGVRTSAAPDGDDAAWVRVGAGEEAVLDTTVNGPGTLRFRTSTKASIETGARLVVSVDRRPVGLLNEFGTIVLPPGPHEIRWAASVRFGGPATAMLDSVGFESAAAVSLAEALDGLGLVWKANLDGWLGLTSRAAPDGEDAAIPPALAPGEEAWIETTVAGPGRISFRWPLADQESFLQAGTPLRLLIDSQFEVFQNSSVPQPVVEVGPGEHSFRWIATGQENWRLAILDEVRWAPLGDPPTIAALDGVLAPVVVANGTRAQAVSDITHDGVDAVRLLPATTAAGWESSPSLANWVEGPGHLFFWYRVSDGAVLTVNGVPPPSFQHDGSWERGIVSIPPGWRQLTWGVATVGNGDRPVWIDELSFVKAPRIPLHEALPELGSWRTSPEAAWVGLPADYFLKTYSSAQSPASIGSWIEADVTGPAVVAFLASGPGLAWWLDGREAGGLGGENVAGGRSAVVVPAGLHTLRWSNPVADVATLAMISIHPMAGNVEIRRDPPSVLLRIPRPMGFNDAQISLERLVPAVGQFWSYDAAARVHRSDPEALTFVIPGASGGAQFWRAAYTVR